MNILNRSLTLLLLSRSSAHCSTEVHQRVRTEPKASSSSFQNKYLSYYSFHIFSYYRHWWRRSFWRRFKICRTFTGWWKSLVLFAKSSTVKILPYPIWSCRLWWIKYGDLLCYFWKWNMDNIPLTELWAYWALFLVFWGERNTSDGWRWGHGQCCWKQHRIVDQPRRVTG